MAPQRQINIRLPEDEADLLEIGAFLDREPLADYIRAILRERIAMLQQEPRVSEIRRIRAEHEAVKSGDVSELEAKRRSKNGGES
ncbi:MAG TPA: hypothetical protein VN238_20145 [Solirubrobacteraceae bacterium]|nr:hypothetical protein [Solirubrobacteraceae bacterium]